MNFTIWETKNNFDLVSLLNGLGQVVYIEFTNAFDRVDHEVLLSKLRLFGLGDSFIDLFESYLRVRRQYVK